MPRDSYYLYFVCLTTLLSFYLNSVVKCSMRSPDFYEFSTSETGSIYVGSNGLEDMSGGGGLINESEVASSEGGDSLESNTDSIFYTNSPVPSGLLKRKRKLSNVEEFTEAVAEFIPVSVTASVKRKCAERDVGTVGTLLPEAVNVQVAVEVSVNNFEKDVEPPTATLTSPAYGFHSYYHTHPANNLLTIDNNRIVSPFPMRTGFLSPVMKREMPHNNLAALSPESVIFSPILHTHEDYDEDEDREAALKRLDDLANDADGEDGTESELNDLNFDGFGFYDIDEEGRINGLHRI